MKNILYVTTVSRTINAFLVPHIKMLLDKGHRVDCACCIDKDIDETLLKQGVSVFNIPFTRNPLNINNLKALNKLIKLQKKNKYDVVHVHTPVAALYGRLLKLIFPEIRTIYTVHGFHFYKGAPMLNWMIYYPMERIMAKFTDTIVTINDEDYKKAQKFNIKETYKVNGVGIDTKLYSTNFLDKRMARKNFYLEEDDFVILMIAEVNKNKNHKQMIDSVEILKKKGLNVKVICAGDGPLLKRVQEDIRKSGLNDSIRMLGFRNDISELIAASDLGILMSHREGLPRNIMELMAFGKPVIGTNIRGIRDIIIDGINGFLVEINDAQKTAERIELLYHNQEILKKCSDNAIISAKNYEINRVLAELEKIL